MLRLSLVVAIAVVVTCAVTAVTSARDVGASAAVVQKERMIVLSDIEADPDDTQSLVRLLLYSNEIDIEGLVATTSVWMQHERHPESIRAIINAYAKVRANLLLHAPGYPTAEHLLSLVSEGQPIYGAAGIGKGKDSPGSELIIRALESSDPRPLWVSVWGGANTLAQALLKIRDSRNQVEAQRLIAKLRVYTISDQDDSGSWIRRNFPDLFYIVSTGRYANATWTAINTAVEGIDNLTISNEWLAVNIQQGHGPLGAMYPDVAWGMEGDTPAFLALIPNGLNVPEHPEYGGWGGRYEVYTPDVRAHGTDSVDGGIPIEAETRPIWTNSIDSFTPYVASEHGRPVKPGTKSFKDFRVTLWRWRDDFQNDFAARMDWTTQPYAAANHPPTPKLAHSDRLKVRSDETFKLIAAGSSDPDGDSLSYVWFHYPEAGSWKTQIAPAGAENVCHVSFKAPKVNQLETAHFILKVTDKGKPALSRYQRVIVTIVPQQR
jgi:hypothetical protein